MFFRRNSFWAKVRRFFNLNAWMVKLLGLSIIKGQSARPGTVIIQIDGLSHMEFIRAIQRGEMPHLKSLLKNEGYLEYMHYSGQPSCTPAVQGRLFYGVKSCVPAFSFRRKKTGTIYNMFNPANALEVESRIKKEGTPLLKGGSAYGDIFTGGALEAHFCVSSIGWGSLFSAANPIAIIVFIVMHLHIIIRAAMLVVMEFILAIFDSIRGFSGFKNLFYDIKYVPFRVIACVITREVIGVGAKIDIARGMPVIHMNFAGYDEQAHHRGPKSKFAHWSLRAIDSLIKTIWKAAKRSPHRDYDVIIYSDHGQEETEYYENLYKRPVQEAVNEVLNVERSINNMNTSNVPNDEYLRAELLRGAARRKAGDNIRLSKNCVITTAMGPVGHIYTPGKISKKQKERIARSLITYAKIPLVLISGGRGRAIAWNAEGKFVLPRDAASVLGEGHPFLKETARDLTNLCAHKDAGVIIFCGLKKYGKTLTFYNERGSHGGPGPHETAGFAMLPPGAGMPGKTITTEEIREAVFRSKNRNNGKEIPISKIEAPSGGEVKLKIMSYNIHACKGSDGKISPDRIAQVIAAHNPDIVALQEVDVRNDVHQAKVIAGLLSMNFYYNSSVMLKTGLHGNAVLSRFNIKIIKRGSLPCIARVPFLEKRGALWVEIDAHGRKLQLLNTHLSLLRPEGILQVKYLLGKEWLGKSSIKDPVIFCGDFNSNINSRLYRIVAEKFHSIHFDAQGFKHLKTYPSIFPLGLVDHIFLGGGVKALNIETPGTHLEKTASDHLPLIAEVRLDEKKCRRKNSENSKKHDRKSGIVAG
jgi:endonuclease/exonuclease/phosphatase family metal-dependent hydrolase